MLQEIQTQAAAIGNIDEFKHWVRSHVRSVFPHEALACGYARLHAGAVTPDYLLSVEFPEQYLRGICNPAGAVSSSLFRRWLNTCEVVVFDPAHHRDWPELTPEWLAHFTQNDLRNAVVHAVMDTKRFVATYFSFHRLPTLPNSEQIQLVKTLVRTMHEALVRVIQGIESEEGTARPTWELLSFKEIQVAWALGCGKTNQEIAQLMQQSDHLIDEHVACILKKLNFDTPSHLRASIAKYPPGLIPQAATLL